MNQVTINVSDHVATISFSNPPHNALPGELLADLAQAVTDAGNDLTSHVIVLKSGGDRTFCAGASFDELMAVSEHKSATAFFMGFANVINACRKCPKLIVGRVHGKAVGGGVGIAAAMDYCLATKHASIKLSELALGIGPFVVGPAVQRKIGVSALSQLAINATEWRTAEWAKQKGLFDEVFESVEDMDNYLIEFSGRLANSSPEAMKALKETLWEGCDDWDSLLSERAKISGLLVLSDFTRNAIRELKSGTKNT